MEISYDALSVASGVVYYGMSAAIGVASYRRSRCLSGYPIWRSVLIAVISAGFNLLWLVVWWVNRKRIALEWDQWRAEVAARQGRDGEQFA